MDLLSNSNTFYLVVFTFHFVLLKRYLKAVSHSILLSVRILPIHTSHSLYSCTIRLYTFRSYTFHWYTFFISIFFIRILFIQIHFISILFIRILLHLYAFQSHTFHLHIFQVFIRIAFIRILFIPILYICIILVLIFFILILFIRILGIRILLVIYIRATRRTSQPKLNKKKFHPKKILIFMASSLSNLVNIFLKEFKKLNVN